ncbi:MAG: hypothetical protein KDE14_16535 [Rhodobacteraceae bacterium]|nr:hypothetical protein [Paracoccaceae bacterium]
MSALAATVAGAIFVSAPVAAAVIDDFSCAQVGGFQFVQDAAHGGPTIDTDTGLACAAGGTRTLELFDLTGTATAFAGAGVLSFDTLAGQTGKLRVTWSGLGGVDLTAGGGTQFEFQHVRDGDLSFELTLTDTFGGAGVLTYFADPFSPSDGITPVTDVISYFDFSIIGSLSFTSIATISLVVNSFVPGVDSGLFYLQTNGTVPLEPPPSGLGVPLPASLALSVFGLFGIAATRRRAGNQLR